MTTRLAPDLTRPADVVAATGRRPWELWRRLATFRGSTRLRILGWYVVLMAVAIGASLVIEHQVLLHRLGHRTDSQLSVDAAELSRQASAGGPGASSVSQVFDAFLKAHVPAPDEEFVTLVDGRPYATVGGQYRLDGMAGFIHEVAGVTSARTGTVSTPSGPVRYLAVPVTQPGGGSGTFVAAQFMGAGLNEVTADVGVAAAVSFPMLLIMTVIAWLVAGRVLAPVRLMTDTAISISETDLNRRIPSGGPDEIGQLASTFNAMLDRLQAAFVSQRNFVNDAGHELRTPITVIRGHLELLGDDPAERAETLAVVQDELDRMTRMVDDLLLLAKAERPGFLELEPVRIEELMGLLMAKVSALGPRRWDCTIKGTALTMADPQRLTQAVMNLATNAVSHTAEGASITLGFVGSRSSYRLSVTDTGTGIPYEEQSRIFERFARGRNQKRRSQGSGLGLAIVSAIAEAHRGRVELESTPGRGSTFTLVLPVQPPVQERA